MDRPRSSHPDSGTGHLTPTVPPPVRPSLRAAAAAGAGLILLWLAGVGSGDGRIGDEHQDEPPVSRDSIPVALPEVPLESPAEIPASGLDALRRLMPIFASIDGAVLHETDPLVAAWHEPDGTGAVIVFLAVASGLSPTDLSVVPVGRLADGEEIKSVTRAGVILQGPDGQRLLTPPGHD